MTYSGETTDEGTAEITGIVADDSVTAVNVPGSIEHGGQTYKVTELKFSYDIVAENVEQLTLPDTLENVRGWYFRKFVKVKELHIPGSIKDFSCTLQNSSSLEKLTFDEGVEEISANMMVNGCSSLSEINFPSTLKTISGSGAFEGATALKSIEFPKDVVFADTITGVLEGCTSLTSVSLPASVTKIPSHMFDGCTSLTSVTAVSEIESIGDGAFQNCSSLTGIDFPGTLTSIGSSAFQGCSSLVSVPDLSKVTKMGSGAFRECGNLRASVDLSSLQSVPGYAFCYTPVKIVGLCDSLKSIGDWAFIWSNVAVQLPETLEKIGNYTFFGGTLPEQLSIPDSVTSVGTAAFSSVDGVRDVTIGRGLTKIPSGMFDDSTVQKITIENSVDDITGSDNLPSSGVELVYTRESINDGVGDNVSDDSTETLQDLVNAAPSGKETVIKLEKHVKLGSTLTIPARKMIKITSDRPCTVLAKQGSSVSVLVNVAEGASLELSGNVSLRGRYNKGAIISSKGAVVLSDEAVVCDGAASNVNTGVVDVSGDKASLTMTGGVIEQCELKDAYCGVVHAKDGAHVVMKSGVIRKNHVASSTTDPAGNYLSSTGIMLMGNARLDMSGGSIEDNAGYQGGAVVMYSEAWNQRASFEMTGGQLVRNKGYKLGNRTPSGAVHVEGNAEFTLKGGKIEDNIAYSDGKGGGVCVVDRGLQQGGRDHTTFTMKGGSVSGNSASAGGGIYTYSDDVTLSAGEIKGNTAWNMGGGVYSEGNEYLVYSTLHIENARVVDNYADEQGGGMWFCPTGDAKVYVQDGGLIAKNKAGKAGDDLVFTGFKDAEYKLTLANRAPGGGKVNWYKDGGLFNPEGTYAATNPDIPRFTPDGDNGEPLSFTDATPNVALKSVMSEDVYNLGGGQTSLTISGNTAKRGGGIGANGGVIIGKSENIKIPVKKVWENPRIPHPNKVKVNLKNGKTVIDSITLSESDGWEGVFSNLPKCDASGAVIKYTVAEVPVEGYSSKVTGDAKDGFTVTNTSTAKVSVPVEKKWVGPAAKKATVRLLADGEDAGKSIDLTESNGWKGSFEGLPKYSESGSEVSYAVAEVPVEGYSSKVTGDAKDGFTVTNTYSMPREGSLTVKKTVVGGDSQREFGFTVALADGDGEPVSGIFGKDEHAVTFTDGKATFTLKDGEEKTVAGLPVGAHYTVTEDAAEGYTTTVNGADGSKAEGTVTEDGATVAFTNTYGTATEGRDVSTAGLFTKTLEGRDWAEGDSFRFTLTGEGGAPMPEGSADGSKTVSVTAAAGTKAGDRVAFDFGSIRYTLDDIKDAGFAEVGDKRVRAKTFTYTVREVRPDDGSAIAGVDYDGHTATMTVTVIDDGSGNLTATTPAIAQASGGDFVNTYTTELDYSARAGVRLSKTLSGRAMGAGQFAFTVTADAETAAKLGLKTDRDAYAVAATDDGAADLVDLIGSAAGSDVKFTDADAGKTYSFTVTETKLGGEGYANDTAPRTVTIAPAYDAATGKLTVTTTVAKDGVEVARGEVSTADDATAQAAPVTVAFQNSYEATGALGGEGNVAINASKTLTGRAAAAGEFSFSVRDAQGNVAATASNRASGDGEAAELAFSPIAYTTGSLEQMVADGTATKADDGSWSIPYTVSEDTAALPAGVTAAVSSFGITVKVTDNGKGGLDVAVAYPEGSDGMLSFVNGYGTNEATVDLAGTKTLALSQAGLGLTQADIAGKYTFKIEPLDGAPAPVDASGKTVTEATNDAAGNVELGHVTFKQPSDLDDAEIDGGGLCTKTFAYRVSESGSVDGVVNDATATRTFTVKVVEDTNAGTLAAEVLPAEDTPEGKGAFEFTNTYGVNPTPSSVTDQITVSKMLEGRDLAEGEFEFQLVEIAADGSESVAATGRNAADGTVALSPVTYTAPGTHSYELREVAGTAGGVTYDKATYRVRTTVTDAKNGTLAIKHELVDAEGNAAGDTSATFTNGYEAAPVTLKLGAAKVLKGAKLKAGQFSFELKSQDGKVMSTAKSAADGSVTFDALTFKQAGTYTFTVSEVDDGQAHVTYDKAVHKIVVTVGDEAADGTKTGYLSAKVSYEGDANVPPVFTNSYAENPGTPGTPENPGTPGGGSGSGSDNGSGGSSGGDGSKGGMPDTGDRSLPVEALGAMAGIGALTVAGGAVLYRKRR